MANRDQRKSKLSNLIKRPLDDALHGIAQEYDAKCTRYADDLTFSLLDDDPMPIVSLVYNVRSGIAGRGYAVHHRRKLTIRRRHQRQDVTELVVNGDRPRLPRATRRWLRAVRHRALTTGRATLSPQQRAGWENLERMFGELR